MAHKFSKKIILKYFFIIFSVSLLTFNWNKISWIFYPSYVVRILNFFLFENEAKQDISQIGIENKGIIKAEDSEEDEAHYKQASIEISKIKISAPLIVDSRSEKEVVAALDRGAVLWPDSVFPGQKGEVVILGHSAPPGWPKIKYDWIFSDLNLLEKGDEITIYFKNKKYVYKVENKIILNRGQDIPKKNREKSTLYLISCWPPGKNIKRILVEASLE
jgi:LPXTG-site transpeptidase (sortase) family protein